MPSVYRLVLCSGKATSCGCAGIYNAPVALESYATVFEQENALDKFEAFASLNGPRFYGLPVNEDTITLEQTPQQVPQRLGGAGVTASDELVPFHAGEELGWRLLTAAQLP